MLTKKTKDHGLIESFSVLNSTIDFVCFTAGMKVRSGRISKPTRKKLESTEIEAMLALDHGDDDGHDDDSVGPFNRLTAQCS